MDEKKEKSKSKILTITLLMFLTHLIISFLVVKVQDLKISNYVYYPLLWSIIISLFFIFSKTIKTWAFKNIFTSSIVMLLLHVLPLSIVVFSQMIGMLSIVFLGLSFLIAILISIAYFIILLMIKYLISKENFFLGILIFSSTIWLTTIVYINYGSKDNTTDTKKYTYDYVNKIYNDSNFKFYVDSNNNLQKYISDYFSGINIEIKECYGCDGFRGSTASIKQYNSKEEYNQSNQLTDQQYLDIKKLIIKTKLVEGNLIGNITIPSIIINLNGIYSSEEEVKAKLCELLEKTFANTNKNFLISIRVEMEKGYMLVYYGNYNKLQPNNFDVYK